MLRGVLTDTQQSTDRARVVSLGSPSEGAEPVLANRSFDLTPGTGGGRRPERSSWHLTTPRPPLQLKSWRGPDQLLPWHMLSRGGTRHDPSFSLDILQNLSSLYMAFGGHNI